MRIKGESESIRVSKDVNPHDVPISRSILHCLNDKWNVIRQTVAYQVQGVKQAHTVLVPPGIAHCQTVYFLQFSHHLLVQTLSASNAKPTNKKKYILTQT